MNIKFSIQKSKIRIKPDDITSNKWIMFRNEIKSISDSFDYDYSNNTASISVNDFLSLMSYEQEYKDEYNVSFIKNKEIERIEIDNKIKEVRVSEKELINKLKKEGFKRTLTKHQLKNVLKMIRYNSAATFSVPGAGKTTEALAFYAYKKNSNTKMIVVCPKNAFSSWDNEIDDCFQSHDSFFRIVFPSSQVKTLLSLSNSNILVNYEKIRNIRNEIESYINRIGAENAIMILDESHRIKHGVEGITGRTLLSLNHLPKYKLILTGTPCPNSVEDLIGQFQFLFPNQLYDNYNIVSKINDHYCRTTKNELGLPKARRYEDAIEMNQAQKDLYNTIVSEIALQKKDFNLDDEIKVRKVRRCIMWLIQITSNPKLLLKLEDHDLIPSGLLAGAESEKIRFACEEAEKLAAKGKKTLIWTNFTQNVETLKLKLAHLGATFIDGSVKIANNDEEKLNNPNCREFRINQFLNSHKGTVDEYIKVRLAEKIDLMEQVLNDDSIQVSPKGWDEYYADDSEDFSDEAIPGEEIEDIMNYVKPID